MAVSFAPTSALSADVPNIAGQRALSAWVRANSFPSAGNVGRIITTGGALDDLVIRFDGTSNLQLYVRGGAGGIVSGAHGLSTGTWSHVFGWADDNVPNTKLYVNGTQIATGSFSNGDVTFTDFTLNSASAEFFDGSMAECAVYTLPSGGFRAADIAALAAGFSPLMVRPEALYGYAPLITKTTPDSKSGVNWAVTGTVTDFPHPRIYYPTSPISIPTATSTPTTGWGQLLANSRNRLVVVK